jgi:hypothetical protein
MNPSVFVQVQLLLGALSALLPLAPQSARDQLAGVLDLASQALRLTQAGARELDDLAVKLRGVRTEIEHMAEAGAIVTADRFDQAFERVRVASAAFRAALAQA